MFESLKAALSNPLVSRLLISAAFIIMIATIVGMFNKILVRKIKDSDIRYKSRKFSSFIGYLLIIILISIVFSDKLGGLNVALGVAGAGIAFALQEVIASVAGWFAISFSHFYRTGDRVLVGGIRGDVIDIGVLRTTLMEIGDWVKGDLYNGRVVRVANSFVFKEPVFNYSSDFPFLWDEITIPLKHGSDYNFARKMISGIAEEIVGEYTEKARSHWDGMVKNYRIEDARIEPLITLTADENWITFTLRYVVDYKSRRAKKDQLFSRLLDVISENSDKVSIASAAMDITLFKHD